MEELARKLAQVWAHGIHTNIQISKDIPHIVFPAAILLQAHQRSAFKTGDCLLVSSKQSLPISSQMIVGKLIYQRQDEPLILVD